eukprot:g16839.t1
MCGSHDLRGSAEVPGAGTLHLFHIRDTRVSFLAKSSSHIVLSSLGGTGNALISSFFSFLLILPSPSFFSFLLRQLDFQRVRNHVINGYVSVA